MVRYSYSFSFTPLERTPGGYMFYFTANRWVDERCVDAITIFQREVRGVHEATDPSYVLREGQGMADLAYQLVSEHYAKRNRLSDEEVNARPYNTSTN